MFMGTIEQIYPFLLNNLYGLKNKDDVVLVNPCFVNIKVENVSGNPTTMIATFQNGSYGYLVEHAQNQIVEIHMPTTIPGKFKNCRLTKNGFLVSSIRKVANKYWIFTSVENEKYGILDSNQNVFIKPIFDWATSTNDHAILLDMKKDDYDSNNRKPLDRLDFIFICSMEDFHAHKAEIFDDYTRHPAVFLYFDNSINKLVLPNFDDEYNLKPGNFWFFEDGFYGLIAHDGKVIIKPSFDLVRLQTNGLAIVKAKGIYALLDNFGNQKIQFSSNEIVYQWENEYRIWKNDQEFIKRKIKI